MKRFLWVLAFFPSFALAGGPYFQHKDTYVQQEFDNVYRDMKTFITSGTAMGDNLGNHVATKTITANFGILASTIVVSTNIAVGDGSVSTPGYGFTNESGMGLYRSGSKALSFASDSTKIATMHTSSFNVTVPVQVPDGTVGSPGLRFGSDTDNGVYRTGANAWALSAAGAQVWATTSAGEITQPLQPSFLAYNSADDDNVTGDGTVLYIDFDTEAFDQGGDFSADTFTAPVTGIYLFSAAATHEDVVAGMTCEMWLETTAGNYVSSVNDSLGSHFDNTLSIVIKLSSGDTAAVRFSCSGGAAVVDILGDSSDPQARGRPTYFSGSLLN